MEEKIKEINTKVVLLEGHLKQLDRQLLLKNYALFVILGVILGYMMAVLINFLLAK